MEHWNDAEKFYRNTVKFFAVISPFCVAVLYAAEGVKLWQDRRKKLPAYLAAPLLVYGAVSWLRRRLDRPRPFEKDGKAPLLPHAPGRAFPSRHAAMAGVLAAAAEWAEPACRWTGRALVGVVCVSRVACRLHSVGDVLAGAALGLGGGLGFYHALDRLRSKK